MGGLMQGWKTWAGGMALVLTGVSKCISAVSEFPTIDGPGLTEGLLAIGSGLSVIGLGHKIEKSDVVNVK